MKQKTNATTMRYKKGKGKRNGSIRLFSLMNTGTAT
jgi:hypothetical protein